MKIRVLVMKPRQKAQDVWIEPTHDTITTMLGGEMTMSNPLNDGTVIICREGAGKDGTVVNRVIRNTRGQIVKAYYGTIIVAGLFLKAGELDSLTDKEIQQVMDRLEMVESEAQL